MMLTTLRCIRNMQPVCVKLVTSSYKGIRVEPRTKNTSVFVKAFYPQSTFRGEPTITLAVSKRNQAELHTAFPPGAGLHSNMPHRLISNFDQGHNTLTGILAVLIGMMGTCAVWDWLERSYLSGYQRELGQHSMVEIHSAEGNETNHKKPKFV